MQTLLSSSRGLGLGLAFLLSGCAGPSERGGLAELSCPHPVGPIIRDNCEVYEDKFASLKAELETSLAQLVEVQAAVGKASLRDPAELVGLLSVRASKQCRDFNSCAVRPLEYQRSREQTDCVFSSVAEIKAQLNEALSQQARSKLAAQLVQTLEDGTCGSSALRAASSAPISYTLPERKPSASEPVTFYHSHLPWFGTSILPPQPAAVSGVPQLVYVKFDLEHVFRGESPHGVIGYRPNAQIALRGEPAAEGDELVARWSGDHDSGCKPVGSRNGLALAHCEAPDSVVLTQDEFSMQFEYRRGADVKSATLAKLRQPVLSRDEEDSRNGSRRWGVDHDALVRAATLVFRPDDRTLPSPVERPHLRVPLKVRKRGGGTTASCRVNGEAVGGTMKSTSGGFIDHFRDLPRYERIDERTSVQVANPFINWIYADFALPFVVIHDSATEIAGDDGYWPRAGRWKCVVSLRDEPVRELQFVVKSDGRLKPHPKQTSQPRAAWRIETRLIKNSVEIPVR